MNLTSSAAQDAPVPARPRLVNRARHMALTGLLLVAVCAVVCTSLVAHTLGSAAHILPLVTGLLVGSLVAWALAGRGTVVVEQLFEQEDRMLRAAVHELTRPLSRLVATLSRNPDHHPPEAVVHAALIHARTLHRLVEDLSEAARVMTGAAALAREPVRLDHLVATLSRQDELGDARLDLVTTPAEVTGSPRLLRLAVANLARNAAQHAYHNGPGTITVRVDGTGIAVLDTGPGMDKQHLDQLSRDLWMGLPDGRARLGLNLVSWVTQVHGGRLHFSNRPEGGLQVVMELPVHPPGARPGLLVAEES